MGVFDNSGFFDGFLGILGDCLGFCGDFRDFGELLFFFQVFFENSVFFVFLFRFFLCGFYSGFLIGVQAIKCLNKVSNNNNNNINNNNDNNTK